MTGAGCSGGTTLEPSSQPRRCSRGTSEATSRDASGPLMKLGRGFAQHATPAREGKLTGYGLRLDRDGTGGIRAPSPGGHVLSPRVHHSKCLWPGPSRFPWWLFGFSSRVGHSGLATTSAHLMSPLAKGPLVRSTCLSRTRSEASSLRASHQTVTGKLFLLRASVPFFGVCEFDNRCTKYIRMRVMCTEGGPGNWRGRGGL